MKKYLIASGCSFTGRDFRSLTYPGVKVDWPTWPELLAKKLDMIPVNLGRSGSGNDYIYGSLLSEILSKRKKDIGLVVPAWTEVQRVDVYNKYNMGGWVAEINPDHSLSIHDYTLKSLRNIISLQLICERFEIECYQFQMLPFYTHYLEHMKKNKKHESVLYGGSPVTRDNLEEFFMTSNASSSMINMINTDKFIGWPSFSSRNGWSMQNKYLLNLQDEHTDLDYKNARKNSPYIIGPDDTHPNDLGHRKIASILYENIIQRMG